MYIRFHNINLPIKGWIIYRLNFRRSWGQYSATCCSWKATSRVAIITNSKVASHTVVTTNLSYYNTGSLGASSDGYKDFYSFHLHFLGNKYSWKFKPLRRAFSIDWRVCFTPTNTSGKRCPYKRRSSAHNGPIQDITLYDGLYHTSIQWTYYLWCPYPTNQSISNIIRTCIY